MSTSVPVPKRWDGMGLLIVALSLSIGWGIRGNFGHEFGAMIPGALAALAAVALSGRTDWYPRFAYFAFFGALGWSFGGSMSYMMVIAYTHSGETLSVAYGFASLFFLGFLWAAMGGAGTALPAFLSQRELAEFFAPLSAVFIAWGLQDLLAEHGPAWWLSFVNHPGLGRYDCDWVAVSLAMVAVLILALLRRRWDRASSLVVHLGIGWWIGFAVLVLGLGWRMTPPRGDNWAGCVGMVLGLWAYLYHYRLPGLIWSSVIAGVIGGLGFSCGNLLKLLGISTGLQTNWHSVLEQTYGLINGLGIGWMMFRLARRAAPLSWQPRAFSWTQTYCVVFVLVGITYLNLVKNVEVWVQAKSVPAVMVGWSASAWFHIAYALLLGMVLLVIRSANRGTFAGLPASGLGKSQILFLVFLWWMVIGNFERALVGFHAERLITEGVIFVNACLCTVGILRQVPLIDTASAWNFETWRKSLLGVAGAAVLVGLGSVVLNWGTVRLYTGDRPVPYASHHVRFGEQESGLPGGAQPATR